MLYERDHLGLRFPQKVPLTTPAEPWVSHRLLPSAALAVLEDLPSWSLQF